jgi:hypothetical protein
MADVGVLADLPADKRVHAGVIDVRNLEVEQPDQVAERIRAVLAVVDAERVTLTTDCGMKQLPRTGRAREAALAGRGRRDRARRAHRRAMSRGPSSGARTRGRGGLAAGAVHALAGRDGGRELATYEELWAWSVDDLEGFWASVWRYFDIQATAYDAVLASARCPARAGLRARG